MPVATNPKVISTPKIQATVLKTYDEAAGLTQIQFLHHSSIERTWARAIKCGVDVLAVDMRDDCKGYDLEQS